MKIRPVLLLTGTLGSVPEVLVAYISSVTPAKLLPSDLILDPNKPEYRSTHLKTTSVLRLHKLATVAVMESCSVRGAAVELADWFHLTMPTDSRPTLSANTNGRKQMDGNKVAGLSSPPRRVDGQQAARLHAQRH